MTSLPPVAHTLHGHPITTNGLVAERFTDNRVAISTEDGFVLLTAHEYNAVLRHPLPLAHEPAVDVIPVVTATQLIDMDGAA